VVKIAIYLFAAGVGIGLVGTGAERSSLLQIRGEIDLERVGGFGISMGAYVLTQAAALDRRLRAVALVSSPDESIGR
jgi:hypothetical protein